MKRSRRDAIKGAAAAAVAFQFQVVPSRVFGANERLTLAGIGIAGKGAGDIAGAAEAGFQITHLCDVVNADKGEVVGRGGSRTRENHPDAKFFEDWREMLDAEGDKIDAVTVSTPDHVHAHQAVAAMRKGCHVYCQKPLTHGIWEARALAEVAAETGVVTQMGNQAHAADHMRRVVELVRAGLIGDLVEVHAWTDRPIWPQAIPRWPEPEEVPANTNWDLWIGPAPFRDYSPHIAPFRWRGFWDFGTGALGDMACHIMDAAWWAGGLGAPESVEAVCADGRGSGTEISPPTWATITYRYPAREGRGPVKFVWYDGYTDAVFNPEKWALESAIDGGSIRERNRPPEDVTEGILGEGRGAYNSLMVGTEGKLWFNRHLDNWVLRPGGRADGFPFPPESLRRARDEDPYKEFHDASRAGDPSMALSNFAESGPFTETVLLGNLAVRLQKKVEWDSESLSSPNCPEAAPLVRREYRAGWDLEV